MLPESTMRWLALVTGVLVLSAVLAAQQALPLLYSAYCLGAS
jgi:hypothetical protein